MRLLLTCKFSFLLNSASQKTLPPSLNDEVCHLKKIQKDGVFHKKLMNSDIKTVQEFLRAHVMDPIKLRAVRKFLHK